MTWLIIKQRWAMAEISRNILSIRSRRAMISCSAAVMIYLKRRMDKKGLPKIKESSIISRQRKRLIPIQDSGSSSVFMADTATVCLTVWGDFFLSRFILIRSTSSLTSSLGSFCAKLFCKYSCHRLISDLEATPPGKCFWYSFHNFSKVHRSTYCAISVLFSWLLCCLPSIRCARISAPPWLVSCHPDTAGRPFPP